MLVTFEKDKEVLRDALEGTRVQWIQLHGYQTPGLVRALKRLLPDLRVIKVLHVRGEACVEGRSSAPTRRPASTCSCSTR